MLVYEVHLELEFGNVSAIVKSEYELTENQLFFEALSNIEEQLDYAKLDYYREL